MKKHPIDELFEKKLSEYGQQPSAAAWEKLSGRKKEKTLKPWLWYAAAGITVALISGIVVWQTALKTADQVPVYASETAVPAPKVSAAPEVEIAVGKTPTTDVSDVQIAKVPVVTEKRDVLSTGDEKGEMKAVEEVPVIQAPEIAQIEVATLSPKAEKQAFPTQEKQSIADKAIEVPKQQENRVVLVTVEAPEGEARDEEKTKGSKFSRVLRQLRNAREGERVDWNEMGIKPKSILVRADDEERNDESRKSKK